jgi:DNA-binding NarL/FixJ family response regulator
METRRVYVVWTHPLFYESMRLLLDDPSIDVVGAISDYAAAHKQIMGLQPDIIIVEEKEGSLSAEVLPFLRYSPLGAHIIEINLSDNQLHIYHREKRTVRQAKDLLHLIQGFQQ